VWQRHEGRGACRPAKVMHSDDIPEEFYLMMAQDMLLRHRGDATDEVVRVLPSASAFAAGTPQKQSPGARPLTQGLAAATQDLHAPSADFAVSLKVEEPPSLEDVDRVVRRLKRRPRARQYGRETRRDGSAPLC
jgi:hypothetical protein